MPSWLGIIYPIGALNLSSKISRQTQRHVCCLKRSYIWIYWMEMLSCYNQTNILEESIRKLCMLSCSKYESRMQMLGGTWGKYVYTTSPSLLGESRMTK